ncbi:MscL family protein [bacterium]|nr:MscL family protein [bacterium]
MAKSLVDDIIMPPVGWLLGSSDFSDLFWVLDPGPKEGIEFTTLAAAQAAGAVTVNYGKFLNNLIALFLVAVVMFILIRTVNRAEEELEERFGDKPEPGEPTEKKCRLLQLTQRSGDFIPESARLLTLFH